MRLFVIIVFVLIAAIALTYLSATLESQSDGWDIVGFPFLFYKYTAAKITLSGNQYFSIFYLLADIAIYIVTIVIVNFLLKKHIVKLN